MNNINNTACKVTDSVINKVVVKRWNDSTEKFEIIHTTENMLFVTFVDYLDNMSTIATPHWSIDYLNLGYTTATVYLEF
nr:MAG TPA: hypothetical protein [Caudoviricetes sp.]